MVTNPCHFEQNPINGNYIATVRVKQPNTNKNSEQSYNQKQNQQQQQQQMIKKDSKVSLPKSARFA